jgi:hypothetical protein
VRYKGTDEQWSKNEAQIRKPADGPKSDRRKLAASFFFSSDGLNYITIWWIYSRPWAQKIKTKDAKTNKFPIWQEFFERKQESLPYSLFGSCFFNHRDTLHQQRHEVSILVLITPVVNNCFCFGFSFPTTTTHLFVLWSLFLLWFQCCRSAGDNCHLSCWDPPSDGVASCLWFLFLILPPSWREIWRPFNSDSRNQLRHSKKIYYCVSFFFSFLFFFQTRCASDGPRFLEQTF